MMRIITQRALLILGASTLLTVIPWILSGGFASTLSTGDKSGPPLPLPDLPNGLSLGPLHIGGPFGAVFGSLAAVALWPLELVAGRAVWLISTVPLLGPALAIAALASAALVAARARSRARRRYIRLRVTPYRTDDAGPSDVVSMMEALQHQLLERWWRRLLSGQPSVALEVLFRRSSTRDQSAGEEPEVHDVREASLSIACPDTLERGVRSAIAGCYPHARISRERARISGTGYVLRLKKRHDFIRRIKTLSGIDSYDTPIMDQLLATLGEGRESALVQLALTPTPALFDAYAARKYRKAEHAAAEPDLLEDPRTHRPSRVAQRQLEGGLDLQHRALFFTEIRVMAKDRATCERIGGALRTHGAENRLVERGTSLRHGRLGLYRRRVERGEGNPLPSWHKGVMASTELATLWHVPSLGFSQVPLARSNVPRMPAPPGAYRPRRGPGLFSDEFGPLSIDPRLLSQNVKIVGAIEQGKTSTLVSRFQEDIQRRSECVVLFDPKGDAADAALGKVPDQRAVTFLDLAKPMVGFNPMWVPGVEGDAVADYILNAMRNLFDEGDIKASSDRYLRNAIIAAKAYEGDRASLWHVQKVLSVSPQGEAYRRKLGEELAHLPEIKEIVDFFRSELTTQLRDSGQTTTAKLDAPANKLARFLNSQSIKRILQEDHELVDFDKLIREQGVLIVKGAMGWMGADNTAVIMQLLTGMLDAALARQQDAVDAQDRVLVNFICDEAPYVFTRGFTKTLATKRSAGLRVCAGWQSNSQWIDRDMRAQLDALFGHHIWCATSSAADAREAVDVMMAEFTDSIRPGESVRTRLRVGPDVPLNLGPFLQLASLKGPSGRLQPFIASTNRVQTNQRRIGRHLRTQWERQDRDEDLEDWMRQFEQDERPVTSDDQPGSHERLAATPASAAAPTPAPDARDGIGDAQPHGSDAAPDSARRLDGTAASDARRRPAPSEARGTAPDPAAVLAADAAARDASARRSSEGGASRRKLSSPESLNELAVLDMLTGIRRSTPTELPNEIEEAVLAALDARSDRSITLAELRTTWFPRKSRADAARAMEAAVTRRWLRHVQLDDANEGYVLEAAGARALVTTRVASRPLRHTDFEVLAWLAEIRVAFSTQIGRRFYSDVKTSTQQRNMRKLFDAGLVDRFQFVLQGRRGTAACYLITEAGLEAVRAAIGPHGPYLNPTTEVTPPDLRDPAARQPRHDLHVGGWIIALTTHFRGSVLNVRGPQSTVLKAGTRRTRDGFRPLGPDDIKLSGDNGEFLHSFRSRDGAGGYVTTERFATITPDAAIELQPAGAGRRRQELLIEVDRTERPSKQHTKFARYDHFLTGWWRLLDRYSKHMGVPNVVFVCAGEAQVLQFLAAADEILTARIAIPGQPASTWQYPARDRIWFVSEPDIHSGDFTGLRAPSLPIDVREQLSDGTRRGLADARVCRPRLTMLADLLDR